MTYADDEEVMRFVADEVEKGALPLVAVNDLATNNPRVMQLRQMIAAAIAWGREHPKRTTAALQGDAPAAFADRFDGLEF